LQETSEFLTIHFPAMRMFHGGILSNHMKQYIA